MMNDASSDIFARLRRNLIDSYDEELELELDDAVDMAETEQQPESRDERHHYFRELFRLQGELLKLQDWVVETGHKLVIVFEGRDAASKGGIIKRITPIQGPRKS